MKSKESSQLWKNVPIGQMPVDNLIKQCRALKINFIDPEFPPLLRSIFPQELVEIQGIFDTPIQWRRAKDFLKLESEDQNQSKDEKEKSQMELFGKQLSPMDIQEGFLGDYWFSGALASLVEMPWLIERLFVSKIYNEEGVYRVKLCKNGEW
mmetsp:Transcript_24300/g.23909  ORF Transcript_24300/g.23909 Transcript_24300/m.23909 type:complete len:152 (+) Transcript_24300:109-564(+)